MGNSAFLSKKINTELDRLEEVTNIPQMDTTTDKLHPSNYEISLKDGINKGMSGSISLLRNLRRDRLYQTTYSQREICGRRTEQNIHRKRLQT